MGLKRNFSRTCINVGNYKTYTQCRACLQPTLVPIIDFGFVPLAGGFLRTIKEFRYEKLYPLTIVFCNQCGLVQAREVVASSSLFSDYFYRSSSIGTLVEHFISYAKELAVRSDKPRDTFVVEIGSNDGVFLRPLRDQGFRILGVDPAKNIIATLSQEKTPTLCAYFGEKTVKHIIDTYGQADIIVTSNSFAHIDDMHDVMRGVVSLLKKQGMMCIEAHYLGTLMKEIQYDMMYHEHHSYYSLYSLGNFLSMYDMEVFDVKKIPIHAGSMRYYVQFRKTGKRERTQTLKSLVQQEQASKLTHLEAYVNFADRIAFQKKSLLLLLEKLKKQGKSIYGYGASGRATLLMSYIGIDKTHLTAIIDDSPSKQGSFTPGNHIPIIPSQILETDKRPDYCLLFAWSFIDEVLKRNKKYIEYGGKFITPLPTVKIIT